MSSDPSIPEKNHLLLMIEHKLHCLVVNAAVLRRYFCSLQLKDNTNF